MPSPKKQCPTCMGLMHPYASQCRKCKPSYLRTDFHRQFSRQLHLGKPKNYPTGGSLPGVAKKISASWTKKRKEIARQLGLKNAQNPEWRKRCGLPREKNPRWENGRSGLPYEVGFSRKIRELVYERDKICQDCNSNVYLCVHHSDFEKKNHDLKNLILLCRSCHTIRHVQHAKSHPALSA